MTLNPSLKQECEAALAAIEPGKEKRFALDRAHQVWGEVEAKWMPGNHWLWGTSLKPFSDRMSGEFEITVDTPNDVLVAKRRI
jgi:hypothetical protein